MEHALIVAADKVAEQLGELLRAQYSLRVTVAASGSQARRQLLEREFDLLVVNAPLCDESGIDLSVEAAEKRVGVLLLVKSEAADEISAKVEAHGVFVVEKPLNKPFFYRALGLVHASGQRLKGLESERTKLQRKIEEIRLVDRAKCVLIQYLGMTEPQAHRHIEKQAMDLRCTRREVAEGILKTYET